MKQGMWLGAIRSSGDNKNVFVWKYSKTEVTGFVNWNRGQPDNKNGSENCLEMFSGDHWSDYTCESPLLAMCEVIFN